MEMCYDGNLVMPSKFVAVNEEEMTYVEGGTYYSGKKGWAAAAALTAAGAYMSKTGVGITGAAAAGVVGGPIGWIVGAIVAATGGFIAYGGGQLLGAGSKATWLMATKGHFTLNTTRNPFDIFDVH